MKRVLVLLVACATPTAPAPDPDRAQPSVERVIAPLRFVPTDRVAAPPVSPAYAHEAAPVVPVRHAIHGDIIRTLAVSDDGTAVVSADNSGGVRLWPTLDGTREPAIVAMRAPRMLAIGRVRRGFAIAGVDELGQLELVRATGEGASEERVAVTTPRPIVAVHVVVGDVIAERDDHVIAVFDPRGALRGELSPEPGERIVEVATRRDRAIALIERGDRIYGRWLELGAHVAWGTRTPRLPIDARPIALAPDGERIAATRKRGHEVVIVSLARGRVVTDVVTQLNDPGRVFGFVDDSTFVFAWEGALTWSSGNRITNLQQSASAPMAIADTQVVFGGGEELDLLAPGNVRHVLGYRASDLTQVLGDDDGWIASTGNGVITLDAALHTDRVLDLADPARPANGWRQLGLLDRHTAVAYGQYNLYAIDLAGEHPAKQTASSNGATVDPRTGLVAGWSNQALVLARFDAATHTLSKFVAVPKISTLPNWYSASLVLLDPELTGNVAAIVEYGGDDTTKVTDIVAFDPDAAEPFELGKSHVHPIPPELHNTGDPRLLVTGGLSMLHTSPDGTLVAEIANNRMTLRAQGMLRWTVPSYGATALVWSSRGELVAYGNGAARVDLATGALRERACGWRFGLWNDFSGTFGGARLCEAP